MSETTTDEQYLQLNQCYKEKKWQDYINLALILEKNPPNFNDTQSINFNWWLGQSYKNLKQYDKSSACFQKLIQSYPNNHLGFEGLVNIAQHQQNRQLVIERATVFQEKFPNLWHSYWWLGHAFKDLRQYDKAEQQFKTLIEKLPNDHRGYEGLVNIAQHQQNRQLIIEQVEVFQDKFPHMWQGFWWAGHAFKDLRQYDKAEQQFQTLIDKFPNIHQGFEGLVNVSQHENDWQKTIELSQQFIKKFPQMWQGFWWLGHAYKNLAEYEQAEAQFAYLMKEFVHSHLGVNGFIDLANDKADWLNAFNWSEIGIEKFPNHIPFYHQRGMALIRLKKFDEAENYFLELSKQFPDDPSPLTGLASMYHTLRKWDKSIAVLQKALLRFPTREHIARQLIDGYLIYNEPEDALSVFHQYLGNHESISNQLLLARIYQIQHGNGYYLDMLEELYEKYPDDVSVAITYANALINLTLEGI